MLQSADPIYYTVMARGTKPTKHDEKPRQHREEQLGLAHAEYNRILALGGKPRPKTIADMDDVLYTQGQ